MPDQATATAPAEQQKVTTRPAEATATQPASPGAEAQKEAAAPPVDTPAYKFTQQEVNAFLNSKPQFQIERFQRRMDADPKQAVAFYDEISKSPKAERIAQKIHELYQDCLDGVPAGAAPKAEKRPAGQAKAPPVPEQEEAVAPAQGRDPRQAQTPPQPQQMTLPEVFNRANESATKANLLANHIHELDSAGEKTGKIFAQSLPMAGQFVRTDKPVYAEVKDKGIKKDRAEALIKASTYGINQAGEFFNKIPPPKNEQEAQSYQTNAQFVGDLAMRYSNAVEAIDAQVRAGAPISNADAGRLYAAHADTIDYLAKNGQPTAHLTGKGSVFEKDTLESMKNHLFKDKADLLKSDDTIGWYRKAYDSFGNGTGSQEVKAAMERDRKTYEEKGGVGPEAEMALVRLYGIALQSPYMNVGGTLRQPVPIQMRVNVGVSSFGADHNGPGPLFRRR